MLPLKCTQQVTIDRLKFNKTQTSDMFHGLLNLYPSVNCLNGWDEKKKEHVKPLKILSP